MSEVTPETQTQEPKKLGHLASWGLLAGSAFVGLFYVAPVVVPAVLGHLGFTALAAGTTAAVNYFAPETLTGVKSFFGKVASYYNEAWQTVKADWKGGVTWGKEQAAKQQALQAPDNDNSASTLGTKATAPDFNASATAEAALKHAKPAPVLAHIQKMAM